MGYFSFLQSNIRWLAVGALLTFSSSFGQTYFISLFADQIRAEFSLTHGEWGGIYTLGTGVSAFVMIWIGTLTDRFRTRHIGSLFLGLLAISCVLMSLNTAAWALVFVIFALRFTGQGMIGHIAIVSMARWFSAERGKALTIAGFGFSIGQAIIPILFVALMAVMPWRQLWLLAAILPILMIPVLMGLLKIERSPRSMATASDTRGNGNKHWTRREMLAHPTFWLIFPALIGPSTFGTALLFQQVHFVQSKGWQLVEFVSLMPLFTIVAVATTIVGGWAVDRWGSYRFLPLFQLPFAGTFIVLASGQTILSAAFAFVLFGIMQGLALPVFGSFWAEHYGTRHLGAIKAVATSVMVAGSAIGPGLTGYLIDAGVDFVDQMYAIAGYIVLSCLLAGFAMRKIATTAKTGA